MGSFRKHLLKNRSHYKMSRYPSAYGHTPSYKSVGSGYPSALSSGSSVLDSSSSSSSSRMRNMEMDMDREMGAMRREMDRDFTTGTRSSLATDPLMKYSSSSMVSPLGGASNKSESSSSYQSKSYSASSSSVDGGLPHYSSSTDSVYKSTRRTQQCSSYIIQSLFIFI